MPIKPTDPLTKAEKDEISRRMERAWATGCALPDDLMRVGVILAMITDRLIELGCAGGGERHPYELVNGREEEIAQQASLPLRPEARAILEKHGLLKDG